MRSSSKIWMLSLLLLLFAVACDKDEDGGIGNGEVSLAGVEKVTAADTILVNEETQVKVEMWTPTPCYEFFTSEKLQIRNTLTYRGYKLHTLPEGSFCITVIGSISDSFTVRYSTPGSYYFLYNQGTEHEIIDTIVVIN